MPYRTRPLSGPPLRTGPEDVYECPDCEDYAATLDARLRDVVAVILSDGADLEETVRHARWADVVGHLGDLREAAESAQAERDRLARLLAEWRLPLEDGGTGAPVAGKEAQELRKGIEALEQAGGATDHELQALLDRVCARDALAYLEERDRVTAERDRLARVLAVEKGDAEQAPAGWHIAGLVSWERDEPRAEIYRAGYWNWRWYVTGSDLHGEASTALESMEAADAALVGVAR